MSSVDVAVSLHYFVAFIVKVYEDGKLITRSVDYTGCAKNLAGFTFFLQPIPGHKYTFTFKLRFPIGALSYCLFIPAAGNVILLHLLTDHSTHDI